ncbi:MAG: hypothetical protein INR71_06710 [Terriglobus roseus]|nr:hypothetical protein [Terriglobus roseus]
MQAHTALLYRRFPACLLLLLLLLLAAVFTIAKGIVHRAIGCCALVHTCRTTTQNLADRLPRQLLRRPNADRVLLNYINLLVPLA